MMDDATRKVLRRACARFQTGIRKRFAVDDRTFLLELQTAYDYDDGCLTEIHPDGSLSCHRLQTVTVDTVYEAILLASVDAVHAR